MGAVWIVVGSIAGIAAIAESLTAMATRSKNSWDAADGFVRPAFGCVVIAVAMLALGLVGRLVVERIKIKWLSLLAYGLWAVTTSLLMLLFVVPTWYWFPYAPTETTEFLADHMIGMIGTVVAKYVLLVPTVIMIGLALFDETSPVSKAARNLLKRLANLLWLPFQSTIFLLSAPRVWWIRKRYGPAAAGLEKRVATQAFELGKTAEAVVPKHIDELPDKVRQSFLQCAQHAVEIQSWRVERGQDEDHGIWQALEAAAGVMGEQISADQTQELGSLQVDYDKAVRDLALTVLKTPPDILREMQLQEPVTQARNAKEIVRLGEAAEPALAGCEASLPLGVRSAFQTVVTTYEELRSSRETHGLTEKKGLKEAFFAAIAVLRRDALTPQQQAELTALTAIRELMVREFGLAFASCPVELLRETGLEKQAERLRRSREILELGRAVETILDDTQLAVPESVQDAVQRAVGSREELDQRRSEFGMSRSGGGVKNLLRTAASTFRGWRLSVQQKTQLESLTTKREHAVRELGIAMLGVPEALFEEVGLTPRFQKLRDAKETLALGEAGMTAVASRRDQLLGSIRDRYDAVVAADESLVAQRRELGLDRSRISQAFGAATAKFSGGMTTGQKQEFEATGHQYDEAQRSLGLALLCATGDWLPPEPLAGEIDKVRNGKLITELGRKAEKTLPKYRDKLGTLTLPEDRAG